MGFQPKIHSFWVCTECWNSNFDILKPCCNSFKIEESRMKPEPEKLFVQQWLGTLYYDNIMFRHIGEIKEYYYYKQKRVT